MSFGLSALQWLSRESAIFTTALEIARLSGSTSSSVYTVRAKSDSSPRCVLRVLDNAAWLAEEPDLAAHEAAALREAERAGLRAPRFVAIGEDDVGFGAPAVLMTFLEGRVELRPGNVRTWLAALAGELAQIHQHRATNLAWRWHSWVRRDALAVPGWTAQPTLWERAIAHWLSGEPSFDAVFIHRDYHPTNVLWQGEEISGVVDWINACRGPAGADVAHCRTNLAMTFGADAAVQFLALYSVANPAFRYDPYWDIDSLLDMCIDGPSFYEPWHDFGLARIDAAALRERIDAHLAHILAHG